MANFTVNRAQNIMDICLQLYGSMDYYVQFCNDNNLTIDGGVNIGDVLTYDDTLGVPKVLNKLERLSINLVNPYENYDTVATYITDGQNNSLTDGRGNNFTFK